ncbi:MAG: hypothetical protein SOT07_01550 [Paludibacteraceae bacterium]|nr:hypothetical protein [Paludibacteraceae bacterium]
MKKVFFSFVCLCALVLTGCEKDVMSIDATKLDNTVEKCWMYSVKVSMAGISATATDNFIWCTERVAVETMQAAVKAAEMVPGAKVSCSYKEEKGASDAETCLNKNTDEL